MGKIYHLDKLYRDKQLVFGDFKLFQIGRLYLSPLMTVSEHFHENYFELSIITSGKGTIITNGIPTDVKKDDIYLSFPYETHEIKSDAVSDLKYDYVAFLCLEAEMADEFLQISKKRYSANERVVHSERIKALISNAISEIDENKKYSNELLKCIFNELMIYSVRKFNSDKDETEKYSNGVTDAEALCHTLMNYIDNNIYSLKNLSELSDFAKYSYGYLSSLFKKTTGENLASYYREKKLETAGKLISGNRLKTTQISEMLGYSSVYAFSKAFTNYYNISPRDYRKNHLADNDE